MKWDIKDNGRLGSVFVLGKIRIHGQKENLVGGVGAVAIMVECVVMLMTILFVERALAKKFDKDGKAMR